MAGDREGRAYQYRGLMHAGVPAGLGQAIVVRQIELDEMCCAIFWRSG